MLKLSEYKLTYNIICGILNGSFISGDRYRDNYISETKDDRNKKIKIVKNLLLVLMSNAIVSILILMFKLA